MGYLFKSQCFETLAEATAAHWSEKPADFTPGATSYLTDVIWSGTAWQIKKYTLSSAGVLTNNTTTNLPVLAFPTCNSTDAYFDGMTLGWGVAAAMVAAFSIKFIARALHR